MQPSVHRYNFSPFFGGHTNTTHTYPCLLALGSSGSRSFSTRKLHDRCIFFIRSIASLRVLNVSTCKCFRPFPSLGITAVLVNHSVTFAPYFLCSRAMKAGGHSYLVLTPLPTTTASKPTWRKPRATAPSRSAMSLMEVMPLRTECEVGSHSQSKADSCLETGRSQSGYHSRSTHRTDPNGRSLAHRVLISDG
jgi:hypothetical protein